MTLESGLRLAQYRLLEPVGEGGMGVVWKAEDTSLGRSAAIKVLPDLLARDPERVARFEREARLLASLNHPHVASIYGFQSAENVRFLAMEFVEGLDLSQRIAQGPIPLHEALVLARQIAEALEHAHEKGIIHRDLKPANVKLSASGEVKVLDFGLAKALEEDPGQSSSSVTLSHSPTITGQLTAAHVLLGTAAYMAPEQARGQKADRRADIWAFGVVFLEMLSGRHVFEGATVSDTLASVLKTEPDWSALPAETPVRVRSLLRRCLDRDPRRRLRDIGEARILLEDILSGTGEEPAGASRVDPVGKGSVLRTAALVVGALVVGVGVGFLALRGKPRATVELPHRKFTLAAPPSGQAPSVPVVAPDGSKVAYVAGGDVWVQELNTLEPRKLATGTGALKIFWSPDGAHIGYISGTKIWKVAASGGDPQLVSDTRAAFTGGSGASWLADGSIVFSRGDSLGLQQVSSLGGDPRTLLAAHRPTASDFHEPCALPGGLGFVFGVHGGGGVESLALWAKGEQKELLRLPGQWITDPWYASSGHILFQRGPNNPGVWALPFSLSRLEQTGEPFLVVPEARRASVAGDGTLVYQTGLGSLTQVRWVDRAGLELEKVGGELPGGRGIAGARDGLRAAVAETENDHSDIWIYDAARGTRTRLTFDPGDEISPVWSPSGEFIAHYFMPQGSTNPDRLRVVLRRADGTGTVDTLGRGAVPSFSPNGRAVSFVEIKELGAVWDMNIVSLDGDRTPRTFLHGNPRVLEGRISPHGDLMAYMSNESGRWEVYLTRYPSGESRWQVSVSGGQWPRWNGKGDVLYFTEADDVMEVMVSGGSTPTLGTPKKLFSRQTLGAGQFQLFPAFDVTPDGQKFLVLRTADDRSKLPGVNVVQNWLAEFEGGKKH